VTVNPNQTGAVQQPHETLRSFLERRERELTHQIAALRAQIESKQGELAEIQTVRATLAPAVPAPPVPDTTTFDGAADLIRATAENRRAASVAHPMQQTESGLIGGGVPRTIKTMVLSALTSHFDDGATLAELRTFIKDVFGREVDRTSISPQLARLREEGAVEQNGRKWRLLPASQRVIASNLPPPKPEDT
jgi:hypothetical protein